MNILEMFLEDESGATAIEYALIAAIMATAIVTAIGTFGADLKTAFTSIGNTLKSKTP